MNILDAQPRIWDPAPAPKLKVNPPMPPRQVDPPRTPAMGNPTSNLGDSSGSNWVPGKIPTDEEEPKKLFPYRDPLFIKPAVPPPKVSNPIPPFPHQGSKSGDWRPQWVRGHFCSSCQEYPSGSLSKGSFFGQSAQTGGFYPGGDEAY